MNIRDKFPHFFAYVGNLQWIDVHRIFRLYRVTDSNMQQAIKVLLVPGRRAVEDRRQDVLSAINSLQRWLELDDEDRAGLLAQGVFDPNAMPETDQEWLREELSRSRGILLCTEQAAGGVRIESFAEGFDERRADQIGQNGNDGEHYAFPACTCGAVTSSGDSHDDACPWLHAWLRANYPADQAPSWAFAMGRAGVGGSLVWIGSQRYQYVINGTSYPIGADGNYDASDLRVLYHLGGDGEHGCSSCGQGHPVHRCSAGGLAELAIRSGGAGDPGASE